MACTVQVSRLSFALKKFTGLWWGFLTMFFFFFFFRLGHSGTVASYSAG